MTKWIQTKDNGLLNSDHVYFIQIKNIDNLSAIIADVRYPNSERELIIIEKYYHKDEAENELRNLLGY